MSPRENEVFTKVLNVLKDELEPSRIILFGSRAKGTDYYGSDFDFAVDIKKPENLSEMNLEEKIDAVSGLYEVDVVYLPEVESRFRDIVLKTGKVVYERRN